MIEEGRGRTGREKCENLCVRGVRAYVIPSGGIILRVGSFILSDGLLG